MSALADQHAKWASARDRLWGSAEVTAPDGSSSEEDKDVNPIRWRQIIREVARQRGLTVPELLSHRRQQQIVEARQYLFYRLYRETTLSLPQIGQRCGFDHTTVLHSVKRHEQRVADR